MNGETLKRVKEGKAIAIIWDIDDVIERDTDNLGVESDLTDEEAKTVLRDIKHNHDCNYGITWDTIDDEIDEVKGARK